MVDNVKSGDRKLTLINKINDAIDALNADITDLSTNYLNKSTATAQTVTSDTTFDGEVTFESVINVNAEIDATTTSTSVTGLKINKTGATADIVDFQKSGASKLKVDNSGETTTAALVATTFCMGDNTTPVTTYATDVNTTTGESLATTQAEVDKVIAACNAVGILNVT